MPSADRIVPVLARPAAVGDPGPPRPGAVHAEEPAEVHPGVGPSGLDLGRGIASAEISYALCERPPHAAVVRQPAGGRVPPDPVPAGAPGPARPTWCSTSTRPRAPGFDEVVAAAHLVRAGADDAGLTGAVKTSGAKGVHVFVPLTPDAGHGGRGRRHPRHRRPGRAARPGARPRPRSSRRTGTARCSSTRPGPAARQWWPPTARGSGPACRCRSRSPGTSWTTSRRPTSPRHRHRPARRSTPGAMPCRRHSARRGPGRRGPRDPDRPGAGHARGKAPGQSPARRR